MTGFGRAEGAGPTFVLTVEIKSVNHRHLDIALRLPSILAELELPARRVLQSRLERGRVDVTVQLTPPRGPAAADVLIDAALAR
ncbi:MAG TPA: YicC/YloC family endoribonuclease, partial [Candidatus Binatia bacterium]|nr:YicC/YloC family endoribonuclease [Candidatus Binatia bacterium]